MAFNNYNMNNNQNNSNGPKRSWRVGKDTKVSDGKITVGLYESQHGGIFCSFGIISAIGKDPQTGMNVYETRPPMELPSLLISYTVLETIIDRLTNKSAPVRYRDFYPNWLEPTSAEPNCINETFDCGYKTTLTITGSPTEIKLKINTDKGEKVATITGSALTTGVNFADWRNLLKRFYFVLSYMETAGIDPEKFANVMNTSTGGMTVTPDNEVTSDSIPI